MKVENPPEYKNPEKLRDLRKVKKFKQRFSKLLEDDSCLSPAEKHSKITKQISKHLNAAKAAKEAKGGYVAIDRKVKLVAWACYSAMKYIAEVYQPSVKQQNTDQKIKDSLLRDSNRVCGDLCRYLSSSLSIIRSDRAPTSQEMFTQGFWAAKSVELYDNSGLDLSSYDVRIRHLFDSSPKQVLLSVIVDLRKLCISSAADRAKNLPPIPNKTIFVEERLLHLKSIKQSSEMLQGFSHCALESINYVKHVENKISFPKTTTEKAIGQVRKQWERAKSGSISTEEVDAYILGLVMLAYLVNSGPQGSSLPFFLSLLMKTPPLWDRLQILINPDKEISWTSAVTEYIFLHSEMEGESFRAKLQRLNSRPLCF